MNKFCYEMNVKKTVKRKRTKKQINWLMVWLSVFTVLSVGVLIFGLV